MRSRPLIILYKRGGLPRWVDSNPPKHYVAVVHALPIGTEYNVVLVLVPEKKGALHHIPALSLIDSYVRTFCFFWYGLVRTFIISDMAVS